MKSKFRAKILIISVSMGCFLGISGCNSKPSVSRPSGIKNMAPLPIGETVQEGLDVEPNNTFIQAASITMTGDGMQWAGSLDAGDVDVWRIKAKAGTIADIVITPEGSGDIIADYSLTDSDRDRHYYDMGSSGEQEYLHHIRLTPQGGFLTVKARNEKADEPLNYRIAISRVPANDNEWVESEPNGKREDAMTLTMPLTVVGGIYPSGDVDFYRLPITSPAVISFDLPDGAYDVAIFHRDTMRFHEISRQKQVLKSDILTPDLQEVWIRLTGLEAAKKYEAAPYRIEIAALDKVPDEIEPNDTIENAQTIQGESQNLEFSLKDALDVDIFRIMMPPGGVYRARLTGIEPGQAKIQAIGNDGQVLPNVLSDEMHICDVSDRGNGILLVKVTNGKATSWPLSYRIAVESDLAENVEKEPNPLPEQATELSIGQRIFGHIFPNDDVDMYRIQIPETPGIEGPVGTLSIDLEAGYPAKLQLKLQDSAGYEISQMASTQISRPLHMAFDAPKGIYTLMVTGSGDSCTKPYVLRASFKPKDEAIAAAVANPAPSPVQNNQPVPAQGNAPSPVQNNQPVPAQGNAEKATADDIAQILEAAGASKPTDKPEAQPQNKANPPNHVDEDAF